MTLGPSLAVYLNVKPDIVITFLTACLAFGLAVLGAKYPNTLFSNQTIDTEDGILNDEYTLQSLGGEDDGC